MKLLLLVAAFFGAAFVLGGHPPLALVLGAVLVYFLPWLIAWGRGKSNTVAIFVLNLLLGWTLVGWVVALVWASTAETPAPAVA